MAERGGEGGSVSRRIRATVSVLFTLLLVAGEFALLSGVYHLADGVREQRVVQAEFDGRLEATIAGAGNSGVSAAALEVTALYLPRLRAAGASTATLEGVARARDAVESDPGDPGYAALLSTSVARLGITLDRQHRWQDRKASGIYVALLVGVSIGWAMWFRRLVSRHRALQAIITEQQATAAGEERLSALVQNGADLVMIIEADTTTSFVSPSSARVLGLPPEDLLGRRVVELVHPDDVGVVVQMLASQRQGAGQPLILRMTHADGRSLVLEGVLSNLLAERSVAGFVLTVRDVTERTALEERLTHQAFHDSLTGLANRQLFTDRLTHALGQRPENADPLVVLFCDLDDFKNVNDSLGHVVGDRVLAVVGQRIHDVIRSGDTAARLGGDEFAILMEATDLAEARDIADRIQAALREPVTVDGETMPVQASIGMAVAQPGEVSSEEALRNADVAMYWAKDRGKGMIAVYETSLHEEALDRLELRGDLARALKADELVLHYQPTVVLETGQISGFEALVRWNHPTRGLLPPLFFVPMAEEVGLIVPLGHWVLFEACRTAAALQSDWRRPSMAVNISSQQLAQTDFVEEVLQALAASGLPPDRLVLEITESVVLEDLDAVTPRLSALRELGIRVAIDDFGTGYSSLAYLTALPVDILKVDKSFVDRVTTDEQGASVTEAIIAMSRSMKLKTVAEGVEVAEQAAWLRGVSCHLGQGYFWSRPVDLEGVHRLLAAAPMAPVPAAGGIGSVPAQRAVSAESATAGDHTG